MTHNHFAYIGWMGFVLIVSGYFLVTIQMLAANSPLFHSLNLAGALCMVANARHNKATPLLWLNVVWALVAVLGLLQKG